MTRTTHAILSLTLLLTLTMAATSFAALDEPIGDDITIDVSPTIDANLADWGDDKYVITDPLDDSIRGDGWELNEMWIGVNDTHLFVALAANSSQMTCVYIDTDPFEGTGLMDIMNGPDYNNRPITFSNGFGAELFAGSWAYGNPNLFDGETGWLGNGNATDANHYDGFWSWADGSGIEGYFEYAFSFELLFGSANVTDQAVGILAIAGGGDGDTALDTIPNSFGTDGKGPNDAVVLDNFVYVDLDNDTDSFANLIAEPEAGWFGGITHNAVEGNASAGIPLEFGMNVYWRYTGGGDNKINDHPNMIENAFFNFTVQNEVGTIVDDNITKSLRHVAGAHDGNNDIYNGILPSSWYDEGYRVNVSFWPGNWAPGEGYTPDIISMSFPVGPAPITGVDYVAVSPAGGFTLPDLPLTISATTHWYDNDTSATLHDGITGSLPVDVTLNYEVDHAGVWNSVEMAYVGPADINDAYTVDLGPYPVNTTVVYYVNASADAGFEITDNATMIFGIEPDKALLWSMTDDADDEWGPYATGDAFDPWTGYFDLLYFGVYANEYNVQFTLQYADLSFDDWSSLFGFSHQIISIYIDNDDGGSTESIRNEQIDIDADHPWDHALIVDGWTNLLFSSADPSTAVPASGVLVVGDAATGLVNITVPIGQIGTPENDWGYTVLTGSGDFNSYRARNEAAVEWNFGGGTDGELDSNAIDMLVPGGSPAGLQDTLFNSYSVAEGTCATALAVGPEIAFVLDETNPTVEITSPADGFTIDGDANDFAVARIEFDAADAADATLSGLVEIKVFDGTLLHQTLTVAGGSYSGHVNITLEGAGDHVIKVQVFDATGNYAEDTITITVVSTITTTSETSETTTPTPTTTTTVEDTGDEPSDDGGFLPVSMIAAMAAMIAVPIVARKARK